MPIYTIEGPDGKRYKIEGPEGASADDLAQFVQSQSTPQSIPPPKGGIGQDVGNVAAGLVRGAGSIGSTLLAPYDVAKDLMAGKGLSLESNRARRQAIDEGLRTMGAEPESGLYQVGKIGGEIAGTAGVPGILAKGASALKAAPTIVDVLRAGGASGSLPARVVSGAASGATAGALVNPEEAGTAALVGGALPVGMEAIRGVGRVAQNIAGGATGAGKEAFSQAYEAGKQGGKVAQALRESMRGQAQMDDVLTAAKQNLEAMGAQRQAAYRQGMANIKSDKTVLDMSDIGKTIDDALNIATFKGQVKNERAASVLQSIKDEVNKWRSLDSAEFHTPEGLDALKQKIGGILEEIPYEQKTARLAAGKVYDSIKNTINQQAPEYSRVMKDYSEATELMREIEKALIGGNKATAESSMRKLQSLMRNNVNTSYGYRTQLARELEQAGGQQIMPALAGQALNEWTPRGIQRAVAGGGVPTLALTGNIPAAVGMGALSSPRLMGEAFYGAGRVAGATPQRLAEILRTTAYRGAPVLATQNQPK